MIRKIKGGKEKGMVVSRYDKDKEIMGNRCDFLFD